MNIQDATQTLGGNPQLAQQAQQQFQALLSRSATDMAFRQRLLTEPRAAIAEFNGQDISTVPESVNIVFVENKADATIVLPDPIDPTAELSDQELEAVAGGGSPLLLLLFAGGVCLGVVAYGAGHNTNADCR